MTKDDIILQINAFWYNKPRRTRNRIMLEENLNPKYGKKHYRNLDRIKHRFFDNKIRSAVNGDAFYDAWDIVFNWTPPEESYNKPWLTSP